MRKNKIDFEVKLGGVFGAVAIIAIILEIIFNGITASAIVAGIKDISLF